MGKGIKIWAWLITVIATVALINWGLVFWLDFNLVEWISFGQRWIEGTIYTLATIAGITLIPTVLAMTLGKKR